MINSESNPFNEALQGFKPSRQSRFEGHPNELEKTPEELQIIEQASQLLEQELRELFPDTPMASERQLRVSDFIFLADSDIKAMGRNRREVLGFIDDKSKKAIINRTNSSRSGRLMSLFVTLHEGIHLKSSGFFEHNPQGQQSNRAGYQINNGEAGYKLSGFNEAVVEWMTYDLIFKNKDRLNQELAFTNEDWGNLAQSYKDQIAVISSIVTKVSEIDGRPPVESWKEIKKGQFGGQLMHLRKIERAFGKNSLKLLSAMGDEVGSEAARSRRLTLIKEYFCSADQRKRDEIGRQFFSDDANQLRAA